MARTKYSGPVESKSGFRFVTANSGNRPMTVVATTIIRTKAASSASTLTQLCGLTRCVAAWGNLRHPTLPGTLHIVSCAPYGWGSTVTAQILANVGTGQRIEVEAANATLTVFMLGYV
jgi:hypothetical protein